MSKILKHKINVKRSSSKIIADDSQKPPPSPSPQPTHTTNILQRFIRRCSCSDQIKNKVNEGYYYVPWSPNGHQRQKVTKTKGATTNTYVPETLNQKIKNKSISESDIVNLKLEAVENEYGSFEEWEPINSSSNKSVNPSINEKRRNLSLSTFNQANSTISSYLYTKSEITDEEAIGHNNLLTNNTLLTSSKFLNSSSKNSSTRSFFKIKKIMVKSANDVRFEENESIVNRLNRALDEEATNGK